MKKHSISLFSVVVAISILFSACSKKTRVEADEMYNKKEFANAAEVYRDVYNDLPKDEKAEIAFKTAECYRLYNNYKNAERWYERAEKAKYGPEATKMRAAMLKRMEEYTEAIILYNNYLKENPNDADAKKQLEGAELALKWRESGECVLFRVENVKKLNSNRSDNCAVMLKKEAIIFTSDRDEGVSKNTYGWTGNGFFDVWVSNLTKKRGEITINKPELLKGSANTKYNEGSTALDSKGSTMYITQCGGKDGKLYTCQIYQTSKKGRDEWDEPIKLEFCDTGYNYGHPSLSEDGQRLFFSSDIPGGYGGKDIWMVTYVRKGKTWSDPINLGPVINTPGDEMFPSIAADGTLYFSSNEHVGMGGLDMFKSTGTGNEWSKPENLKHPLNSGGDDFAIIFHEDGQSGYFSSNRPGGRGNDDIWEFFPIPQTFKLTGVVKDCNTGLPIEDAGIFISNDQNADKVTLKTDRNGFYSLDLAKESSYELYTDKNEAFYIGGKKEYQSTKGLICSKELVQNFEMCRLDVEGMFNVRGILYDLDSSRIRPDAAKILDDSVVSLLKRFPNVTIELGSHTDCRASAEYNRALAQRRADAAVAYIVSKGIDSARLVAKGYGEDSLFIKKCKCELSDTRNVCTEAEHQLNRRTTVRVLSTNYVSPAEQKRRQEQQQQQQAQPQNQQQQQQQQAPRRTNEERLKEQERKKEERDRLRKEKEEERKRKAEEKKREREEKLKNRKK